MNVRMVSVGQNPATHTPGGVPPVKLRSRPVPSLFQRPRSSDWRFLSISSIATPLFLIAAAGCATHTGLDRRTDVDRSRSSQLRNSHGSSLRRPAPVNLARVSAMANSQKIDSPRLLPRRKIAPRRPTWRNRSNLPPIPDLDPDPNPSDFGDLDSLLAGSDETVPARLDGAKPSTSKPHQSPNIRSARGNSRLVQTLKSVAAHRQGHGGRCDRVVGRGVVDRDDGATSMWCLRGFPDHPRDRPGRDGDRLRGRAGRAGPPRRVEGPAAGRRARPPGDPTVPARGPGRRLAAAPAHRAGLSRVGTVDDVPYLRDAVHRGRQPGRPDRRAARASIGHGARARARHRPTASAPSDARGRACCRAGSPPRVASSIASRPSRRLPIRRRRRPAPRSTCRFATGRISAPSPGWASRRPRRSATPTTRGSSTATSSPPTCSRPPRRPLGRRLRHGRRPGRRRADDDRRPAGHACAT